MLSKNCIKTIVSSLRQRVICGTFDAEVVSQSTAKLAKLSYEYDSILFPPLPFSQNWTSPSLAEPQSLAEALLWKMGKWNIYKSFVEHYVKIDSEPKTTDVVFYAFAKHLKDRERPIYDQHTLRALWAIDSKLTSDQIKICCSLLAKKNGEWKSIASGTNAKNGYELYLDRVTILRSQGASLRDLDKLLMPLGKALKIHSKNVDEFLHITGSSG